MRAPARLAIVLLVLVGSSGAASACEVCFGAPDDPATIGMNNAILFLLGVIALVQIGFIGLFWEFRRRSRELREKKEKFQVLQGGMR